jgi:sulfatase modifying factor 1
LTALAASVAGSMVRIPAATFRMGSDAHYPEEAPSHRVGVDAFWIDRHAVTNLRFAAFVAATDYVTLAERPLDPAAFPARRPRTWLPARWCSPARADPSTCGT